MKLTTPDPFDDDTGDASALVSGCGILAVLTLAAMFGLIIWRAMQ